jgi:F-type H+-transporting ATPase subunit b
MAEEHTPEAVVEVPAGAEAHGAHGEPNVMGVAPKMMGLTWITFLLLVAVLYKVAWKPILAALEHREEHLRKAVENAEQIRKELASIDDKRKAIISEADGRAREIVDAARAAASEAAATIENKAREESQILLENAQREIRAEQEKALAALRKESADLAIGLSRKIIGESLDENRGREIVDRIIKTL